MKVVFFHDQQVSAKAGELIDFDMASIRQAAAGRRSHPPTLWLADPAGYEQAGRVLRDSPSPRLLGYSPEDKVLYANDGCNSCVHPLSVDLAAAGQSELAAIALQNKIEPGFLQRLAELAASR